MSKILIFFMSFCGFLYGFDKEIKIMMPIFFVFALFFIIYQFKITKIYKKQKQSKNELKKIHQDSQDIVVKARNFDMRDNILYFFKTLNYDASKNNNTILGKVILKAEDLSGQKKPFYDFFADPELIISTINTTLQIFNKSINNSTFELKIEMFSQNQNEAQFDFNLKIHSKDYEILDQIFLDLKDGNEQSLLFINKAISFIQGTELKIDEVNYQIGFHFTLPKSQNPDLSKYQKTHNILPLHQVNTYIAHNDNLIVKTISTSIQEQDLKEPLLINLEKFIDFTHNANANKKTFDVFFVATEFLKSIINTHKQSLYQMQKDKQIKIYAIAKNYEEVNYLKHNFDFVQIIMLPYTDEYFEVVVNQIFDRY